MTWMSWPSEQRRKIKAKIELIKYNVWSQSAGQPNESCAVHTSSTVDRFPWAGLLCLCSTLFCLWTGQNTALSTHFKAVHVFCDFAPATPLLTSQRWPSRRAWRERQKRSNAIEVPSAYVRIWTAGFQGRKLRSSEGACEAHVSYHISWSYCSPLPSAVPQTEHWSWPRPSSPVNRNMVSDTITRVQFSFTTNYSTDSSILLLEDWTDATDISASPDNASGKRILGLGWYYLSDLMVQPARFQRPKEQCLKRTVLPKFLRPGLAGCLCLVCAVLYSSSRRLDFHSSAERMYEKGYLH